jgi:hypothetical protein
MENKNDLSKNSAFLALTEIGLGSLLHNFKVPFAGHFLSLNQIFILARSTLQSKKATSGAEISCVVAVLKTLSPMGKKLTPMLAISMQGFLFSLGPLVFGINFVGLIVGAFLSSIWAFVQPLLLLYLFYGVEAINILNFYWSEIQKVISIDISLVWNILFGFVLLKILISIFLVIISPLKWGEAIFLKQERLTQLRKFKFAQDNLAPAWKLALKDLMNPLFLASFVLSLVFLFFAEVSWNKMIWLALRPVAVGFVIFLVVRIFPLENLVMYFEKKGLTSFSKLLSQTINLLKIKSGE